MHAIWSSSLLILAFVLPAFTIENREFWETEDSWTMLPIAAMLARNALIAMLSNIWTLLERLAGLTSSLSKAPSTSKSTDRCDSWNFASQICNVLMDCSLALCRQSTETLCNIDRLSSALLVTRKSVSPVLKQLLSSQACNSPLALFKYSTTASGPDWSQIASIRLFLPFWSHFELNPVFRISPFLINTSPSRVWKSTPAGNVKLYNCSPVHKGPPFGDFKIAVSTI